MTTMKTTRAPRSRKRNLDVTEQSEQSVTEELVAAVFLANKEMNALKNKHDKLRKELYAKMKDLGFDKLGTVVTSDGVSLPIEAVISAPEGQSVDARKLSKIIPMDKFLDVVTVSQKSVSDKLGSSILNQVLVSTKGTENVSVKVVKG